VKANEVIRMPVNGVPSDQWRVKRALGPYGEPMDELELREEQRLIETKKIKNKYKGVDNDGQYTEIFTESS